MGRVRTGGRIERSAGLRRDVDRLGDQRRRRQLVERIPADVYSGVRFRNQGDPILDVSRPPGVSAGLQRETLDLVRTLDRRRFDIVGDPEIATRIASYEMADRLETSAPELMNLRSESHATLEMYGAEPDKPSFARACLLARRMVERGVRFVNIYHEGWDAHSDLNGNHRQNCLATDQGAAALVRPQTTRSAR